MKSVLAADTCDVTVTSTERLCPDPKGVLHVTRVLSIQAVARHGHALTLAVGVGSLTP